MTELCGSGGSYVDLELERAADGRRHACYPFVHFMRSACESEALVDHFDRF